MSAPSEKPSPLARPGVAAVAAALCALAWAFAFPFIKLGLAAFGIDGGDTAAKTLFAGVRFTAAGIIVLLLARRMGRSLRPARRRDWGLVLVFGLVNTALHYFFFYIGLSNLTGSRSSIIDAMSTFLLILFSCLLFPDDHMTAGKAVGCLLGFGGILLVNLGDGLLERPTLMGDGMLVLDAVSAAAGGILTRLAAKRMDAVAATGVSLTFGGLLLCLAGTLGGGRLTVWTPQGTLILLALVAISALGFTLYNQLLCLHPVSRVAIFNALIPILGVTLSCLLLGEPFLPQYAAAGLLVTAGIFTVNLCAPEHR